MSDWYKLVGREVVGPIGMEELEPGIKRVGSTTTANGSHVSTVFLALDHRYAKEEGDPLVFETLVQGGPNDQDMERYSTYEEAEAGHARLVQREEISAAAAFAFVEPSK